MLLMTDYRTLTNTDTLTPINRYSNIIKYHVISGNCLHESQTPN